LEHSAPCLLLSGELTFESQDDTRLINFVDYGLGYFDLETRALEPLENPFGSKV